MLGTDLWGQVEGAIERPTYAVEATKRPPSDAKQKGRESGVQQDWSDRTRRRELPRDRLVFVQATSGPKLQRAEGLQVARCDEMQGHAGCGDGPVLQSLLLRT